MSLLRHGKIYPSDGRASIAADASVYIVDVTPSSPTYGQRAPVTVKFHTDENRYIGTNWLSLISCTLEVRSRRSISFISCAS